MKRAIVEKEIIKVEKYIPGKCFICGGVCEQYAYAHHACAIAYEDDKTRRIRQAINKYEERYADEQKDKP